MSHLLRSEPCSACPYRRDVPSGVWAHHEYEKLRDYDLPTGDQPFSTFMCHVTPDAMCGGWVRVHMNRGSEYELLALRLVGVPEEGIDYIRRDLPPFRVALFDSGNDAADHGQRDIEHPTPESTATAQRLMRKYPRLQWEETS
jgi:Family of unknown function (DUF6283)